MQETKKAIGKRVLFGFLFIGLFLLGAIIFAGNTNTDARQKDDPVATFTEVNGQTKITRGQLDERLALLQVLHPQLTESLNTAPDARASIEQQILVSMIDAILYNKALSELGLTLDQAMTDSIYQQLRQQIQDATTVPNAVLQQYALETNYGQTLFTYFQEQVTDQEIKDFWDTNAWVRNIPAMVNFSNIVVATEAEARDIRARAIAGADFNELAATLSIEPDADMTRGHKTFPANQIGEQVVADVIKQMSIGDISEPFETSSGWQIIKLTNRTEARSLTFEDARSQIVGQLAHKKLMSQLQTVRDAAGIQILLGTPQQEVEQN